LLLDVCTIAVGKPIAVKKIENPSSDQLQEIYDQYEKSLIELFDTHKAKYGLDASAQLNII
jgi:hypothetical protein